MLGGSRAYASSPEKFLKIWCNLVRFDVRLSLKKYHYLL